jgi:hypothetical protein
MTQSAYIKQTSTSNKLKQFKKIVPSRVVISTSREILKAVAPEEIRIVEISFYEHKVYVGEKLIAAITHDDGDFVTQRWVVTIDGIEVHRAETWAKCYSYITWHHKEGTLPLKQHSVVEEAHNNTGNEVMVRIATEEEKIEFDLTDDVLKASEYRINKAKAQKIITLHLYIC